MIAKCMKPFIFMLGTNQKLFRMNKKYFVLSTGHIVECNEEDYSYTNNLKLMIEVKNGKLYDKGMVNVIFTGDMLISVDSIMVEKIN